MAHPSEGWYIPRMRWMAAVVLLVGGGCGGKAIIDPGGAGGSGAGGATATSVGPSTVGPTTTVTSGPPPPPAFDGVAEPVPEGWRLRVTSYGLTCASAADEPPFEECGWYDLDITLFVDALTPGLLVTPESGLGSASTVSNEPGPMCGGSGSGGGLLGDVTIVDVGPNGVELVLGPGWDIVSFDPSLSPVGPHRLALCE